MFDFCGVVGVFQYNACVGSSLLFKRVFTFVRDFNTTLVSVLVCGLVSNFKQVRHFNTTLVSVLE